MSTREQQKQAYRDTLNAGEENYRRDPNHDHAVWYGRLLGFGNRFDEAIAVFTEAIARYPESFELYRQRGHRLLSTRRFAEGVSDLERAAALIAGMEAWIEPDGSPNAIVIPATTIQTNTYYHLGLGHFLGRQWNLAVAAYENCLRWVRPGKNDELTGTLHWLYSALRRAGRSEEAKTLLERTPIGLGPTDFEESPAYYHCLQVYQGRRDPLTLVSLDPQAVAPPIPWMEFAAAGFGVGNWYLCNGETDKAIAVFRQLVEPKRYAAFGVLAAELDLAELLRS
jgi:tetratricopeptide (TPR) repeat protein